MVSSSSYLGILKALEEVNKNAKKFKTPFLFQLAGDDKITSTAAAEGFFTKLGADVKKKIIYPGAYHEVFNDICREQALDDLNQFLQECLSL